MGLEDQGRMLGSGAEYEVRESCDINKVTKKSKGKTLSVRGDDVVLESFFDVEKTPKAIRQMLQSRHILAKVLHILYPQHVPDVYGIKTREHPTFEQDRLNGLTESDIVETEIVDTKFFEDLPDTNARFKIKSISNTRPTASGMEVQQEWQENTIPFIEELQTLGVFMDTRNKNRNFLKTDEGEYMYIDAFHFDNPDRVVNNIRLEAGKRKEQGRISDEDFERIDKWLTRFQKILVPKQLSSKNNTGTK